MDATDEYCSDNSQLIDGNNSAWIENSVLIENENLTWQESGPEITVDYAESPNDLEQEQSVTITDGYFTASGEESNNATQYFSVLDPSNESNGNDNVEYDVSEEKPECVVNVEVGEEEVILPDSTGEEGNSSEEDSDQVLLYSMEGSDDLIAVQIADDGCGNYHKYQYKVRQTVDGQLEAIPGSIEVQDPYFGENLTQEDNSTNDNDKISVLKLQDRKNVDKVRLKTTVSKQTEAANDVYVTENENFEDVTEEYLQDDSNKSEELEEEEEEVYQTVDGVHVTGDCDLNSQTSTNDKANCVTTTKFSTEETSESEYEVEALEEDFQDDYYGEEHCYNNTVQVLQRKSDTTNVQLKKSPEKSPKQLTRNVTLYKDNNHLSYLVINTKEKENVSLPPVVFQNTNLRSILKSNCPPLKTQPKLSKTILPTIISNKDPSLVRLPKEPKFEPIVSKSARQPRKQKIKPVERADSEIIVQPLFYPLIDEEVEEPPIPLKRKHISEQSQWSEDSDPDFSLKPMRKQKYKRKSGSKGEKRRKLIKITIEDSDDEDNESSSSIIQLYSDNEETENELSSEVEEEVQVSKLKKIEEETKAEGTTEGLKEKIKGENDEPEKVTNNEEILNEIDNADKSINKSVKCPKCPKTFLQQSTLKKHMIIHDPGEKTTLIKDKEVKNEDNLNSDLDKSVNKSLHKCPTCSKTFLRQLTLKKHMTAHIKGENKSTDKEEEEMKSVEEKLKTETDLNKPIHKCSICSKTFLRQITLKKHKIVHEQDDNKSAEKEKEELKNVQEKLKNETDTDKPVNKPIHKCSICSKTFLRQLTLKKHMAVHDLSDNKSVDKEEELKNGKEDLKVKTGILINKTVNKCPMCPKTFPRQITLKKHMAIHSVRRNLRSNSKSETDSESAKESIKPKTDLSPQMYSCAKCKIKFQTKMQYNRHQTVHTLKQRPTPKKTPIKRMLVGSKHLRSTGRTREAIKTKPIELVVKKLTTKEIFKCDSCNQTFSQRTLLLTHQKSHKTFSCPNCKVTFTAKLLLEDHLRKKCSLKCNVCKQIFTTPRKLQIHSVSHKPLKSTITAQKSQQLVKTKSAHGGVPVSLKLQKALDKIKSKT